jgi:hypothetical protein
MTVVQSDCAIPAAVPVAMNIVSIRVDEYATAEADRHTGTSRLAPVPFFGISDLHHVRRRQTHTVSE